MKRPPDEWRRRLEARMAERKERLRRASEKPGQPRDVDPAEKTGEIQAEPSDFDDADMKKLTGIAHMSEPAGSDRPSGPAADDAPEPEFALPQSQRARELTQEMIELIKQVQLSEPAGGGDDRRPARPDSLADPQFEQDLDLRRVRQGTPDYRIISMVEAVIGQYRAMAELAPDERKLVDIGLDLLSLATSLEREDPAAFERAVDRLRAARTRVSAPLRREVPRRDRPADFQRAHVKLERGRRSESLTFRFRGNVAQRGVSDRPHSEKMTKRLAFIGQRLIWLETISTLGLDEVVAGYGDARDREKEARCKLDKGSPMLDAFLLAADQLLQEEARITRSTLFRRTMRISWNAQAPDDPCRSDATMTSWVQKARAVADQSPAIVPTATKDPETR
ncbi:MAG: hypothetical protein GY937_23980 [bacterium]|nr:hypothetical protein [bacterium]